jgi:SAM-dependent methyltransferase
MVVMKNIDTHIKEYDSFYSKKDFIHFKQDLVYVQKLCSFLPNPLNSSILDVGCGRGYWSQLFHECGIGRVVGIDISQVALDIARKEAPGAEYFMEDGKDLHFEEKSFDMVFCQGFSEFNSYDLDKTRSTGIGLFKCLKENGLFVIAGTTNLSGKMRGNWIQHKPQTIQDYLRGLGCRIEATYIIDRVIFLRIFRKYAFLGLFSKYTIPAICQLTKLRAHLVCIGRKITC